MTNSKRISSFFGVEEIYVRSISLILIVSLVTLAGCGGGGGGSSSSPASSNPVTTQDDSVDIPDGTEVVLDSNREGMAITDSAGRVVIDKGDSVFDEHLVFEVSDENSNVVQGLEFNYKEDQEGFVYLYVHDPEGRYADTVVAGTPTELAALNRPVGRNADIAIIGGILIGVAVVSAIAGGYTLAKGLYKVGEFVLTDAMEAKLEQGAYCTYYCKSINEIAELMRGELDVTYGIISIATAPSGIGAAKAAVGKAALKIVVEDVINYAIQKIADQIQKFMINEWGDMVSDFSGLDKVNDTFPVKQCVGLENLLPLPGVGRIDILPQIVVQAPPLVYIDEPDSGESISGQIQYTAKACDISGIGSIRYKCDSNTVAYDYTSSTPAESLYWIDFDTTSYTNGIHTFEVVVYDNGHNSENDSLSATISNVSNTGMISGSVRDAVTENAVQGATVKLKQGATLVDTSTTDSNGAYSFEVAGDDDYSIEVTKTGYLSASYSNVSVENADTTYLEAVLQIDQVYAGTGTVSGYIKDGVSGDYLSSVYVVLREGINVTSGTAVDSTYTDSYGSYSFSGLDAGHYTANISKSGYSDASFTIVCLGGTSSTNQNSSMTPDVAQGQIRIMLHWGETPSDLDAHLTGPSSLTPGDRFHIYYTHSSTHDGTSPEPEHINIDLDDVNSYGPETITIYSLESGTYSYYVHDYTNGYSEYSTALSNSNAKVDVFVDASLVRTFYVPSSQTGTIWHVFDMNGSTITSVNTFSYGSGTIARLYGGRNDFIIPDFLNLAQK